jgi:hypothetical protein
MHNILTGSYVRATLSDDGGFVLVENNGTDKKASPIIRTEFELMNPAERLAAMLTENYICHVSYAVKPASDAAADTYQANISYCTLDSSGNTKLWNWSNKAYSSALPGGVLTRISFDTVLPAHTVPVRVLIANDYVNGAPAATVYAPSCSIGGPVVLAIAGKDMWQLCSGGGGVGLGVVGQLEAYS